jgi:hypothetical protein
VVKEKLRMFKFIVYFVFILFSSTILADATSDQWKDSKKTYRDLINEGFEVKAYDSTSIKTEKGSIILFFVTVLQKDKDVYECQEYQTLDENIQTINISMICKNLTQPYSRGFGT